MTESNADSGHVVARADEIGDGDHIVVEVEGTEIGVFNIDGEFYAYTNWCPHHGGPACDGQKFGTTDAEFDREELEMTFEYVMEGQILRCPWHAWEFDVTTGETLHANESRLIDHDVRVEDGEVVVRV